jgi:hypothetical protein
MFQAVMRIRRLIEAKGSTLLLLIRNLQLGTRVMKNTSSEQPIVTVSYVGSEIAEFRQGGERPPRSAKLVVSLSWSWGPAHSRYSVYWLCTDRKRSGWYLWEQGSDYDTGRPLFRMVAACSPYRGCPAKYAAGQLLISAWKGEVEFEYAELEGVYVEKEGLLTTDDIQRIENKVVGE